MTSSVLADSISVGARISSQSLIIIVKLHSLYILTPEIMIAAVAWMT